MLRKKSQSHLKLPQTIIGQSKSTNGKTDAKSMSKCIRWLVFVVFLSFVLQFLLSNFALFLDKCISTLGFLCFHGQFSLVPDNNEMAKKQRGLQISEEVILKDARKNSTSIEEAFSLSSSVTALAQTIAMNVDVHDPKYHCININTGSDSWGLLHDLQIYNSAFPRNIVKKTFHGDKLSVSVNPARINFFMEIPPSNSHYFPNSRQPVGQSIWLMINPEWFPSHFFSNSIRIGAVIAKTQSGVDIFRKHRQLHKKNYAILYTKHTSQDILISKYLPGKKWNEILHLGGKSHAKNTANIIKAWVANPGWPNIKIRHRDAKYCTLFQIEVSERIAQQTISEIVLPPGHNVDIVCGFIQADEVIHMQNLYGIHLCPSESEGYGHYINEARAAGALVVTSNAPPMNELITEETGILIGREGEPTGIFESPTAEVTINDISVGVKKLMSLTLEERKSMGAKSRKAFLDDRRMFYKRMSLISKAFCGEYINLEFIKSFLM